jgi:hypothetical protein
MKKQDGQHINPNPYFTKSFTAFTRLFVSGSTPGAKVKNSLIQITCKAFIRDILVLLDNMNSSETGRKSKKLYNGTEL